MVASSSEYGAGAVRSSKIIGISIPMRRLASRPSHLPPTVPRSYPASPNATATAALPGISPEPPAVYGPLPDDDETARLPSPVSMLSPFAASKLPAGALSPTDVALFPTSPSTAEGCLKEASHTPGALPPGGCPGNPLCGLSTRCAALY